jgi:hypothetical protein
LALSPEDRARLVTMVVAGLNGEVNTSTGSLEVGGVNDNRWADSSRGFDHGQETRKVRT